MKRVGLILIILVPFILIGYFFYNKTINDSASLELQLAQKNLHELRESSARIPNRQEKQNPTKDFLISLGYDDSVATQIAEKIDYVGLFDGFYSRPDFSIGTVTKSQFADAGLNADDVMNVLMQAGFVDYWQTEQQFHLSNSKNFAQNDAEIVQLFPNDHVKVRKILQDAADEEFRKELIANKDKFWHSVFEDFDGKQINKEIYELLTANKDSEVLQHIKSQEISSLTDQQQIATTGAFLCTYQTFLSYVALKLKGWKVFPIYMSYTDLPNGLIKEADKDSSWWRFLLKRDNPFAKWNHVALLVDTGHNRFLFFDSANAFVSEFFTLADYSVVNNNHFTLSSSTRTDLYNSFQIVDVKYLQSYFFASYFKIANSFGYSSESEKAMTNARKFNPNFPDLILGYLN